MAARTRGQIVAQQLLDDITSGVFEQGSKLPPERELMTRYGVGRNSLREAVQSLVATGVLDVRAGAGTTVQKIDGSSAITQGFTAAMLQDAAVGELLELRVLLEVDAAARAAERAEEAELQEIRAALAAYQDAVRRDEDLYARDVAFHRSIAAAAHNRLYLSVVDTTAQLLERFMRAAHHTPTDVRAAAQEHALIAHHILLGDSESAAAAMRAHLASSNERRNRREGTAPPATDSFRARS
ncbi:FCD domain-containing protein [Streptomyces hyaluromycini]|uniref:FCD domain-containing protein n=1 Tax=Streptomyces hyaluromycini TaxID=1377993 RepID=A0ABV1WYL7_9ACTN